VSQKANGSYEVTLTNLGSKVAARYWLDDLEIKKPEQWDGFWRFIAFDIPSKNPKSKLARYSLLKKLKELGFIMVQRSLWVHPYECREELAVIAKAFEVEPYIHFFVAHDFDKDFELRRKFKKYNRLETELIK
jgi:DNA-binding transcriptional regulator PaaX